MASRQLMSLLCGSRARRQRHSSRLPFSRVIAGDLPWVNLTFDDVRQNSRSSNAGLRAVERWLVSTSSRALADADYELVVVCHTAKGGRDGKKAVWQRADAGPDRAVPTPRFADHDACAPCRLAETARPSSPASRLSTSGKCGLVRTPSSDRNSQDSWPTRLRSSFRSWWRFVTPENLTL